MLPFAGQSYRSHEMGIFGFRPHLVGAAKVSMALGMQKAEALAILGLAGEASAKEIEEAYLKRSRDLRWRLRIATTADVRSRCERDVWKVEQARRCLVLLASASDREADAPDSTPPISPQWTAGKIF